MAATPSSTATLSESASKLLLAEFGVPMAPEETVPDADSAIEAAVRLGFPVVAKLCGDAIAHKTERGLVRLRLADEAAVRTAAIDLLALARPEDGDVSVLVAPMVTGNRELIAGVVRDPQFGASVMLGVGGVLAEAVADVVFRPAPLDAVSAHEMIDGLATQKLLGAFRGEAPVDRDALAAVLVGLGRVAAERPDVVSVDVNPLIIAGDGQPVAVDALVEIGDVARTVSVARERPSDAQFAALFEPRGVLVTGASTHPGKFGFVSLHNLLASGYEGAVFGTNLQGEEVLGVRTVADIDALPDGAIDLVFVCTPASANPDLLRACARKGVRAAFLTSAGYGEAGEEGRRAEAELVALADELGILLAGPNGQGVVSTPAKLCAQIVAPYPPAGRIGVASQSGNFVSSFMNYARATGVGISRAVSAGNAAAVTVADYLDYYADDPATAVGLAYLEGITDGRSLMERLASVARRKPLVLVKGGATEGGARAAASHTGALAADDKVFDGFCRAAGITRASTVEEAFEAAATFATQPLPEGPNVVILTTAGGWGVVTSDALTREGILNLIELPEDLRAAIDAKLPPRWSRSNPVDCAGGETRDTIPEVMEIIATHPEVNAVVYLGLGIQANQARMMREGRFYPDHGLERIVAYHERQDQRFAEAADELSTRTGKPILVATELAVADPSNAGPAAVRATGRLCYPSGNRAVTALGHLYRSAEYRRRRGS
ncbi:MAG: acetate--CoA ligase family protein [Actinomycetota bacterium]|nr:acetate--CoA ligase family protein [Actinomycetota bacterium]MDA3011059.1 acetate--CoA ligase family protein [Actinomycetota bacterium]MDA3025794.1 acetate--CoA ligase family protein [Actinomycetota bacterium]